MFRGLEFRGTLLAFGGVQWFRDLGFQGLRF